MVGENGVVGTYKGFDGGLYFGSNAVPPAHATFGAQAAREVQPLDAGGNPDPNGAIVLMSLSMSNATREWCVPHESRGDGDPPCTPESFMGQADADPSVNHNVVLVNGARDGQHLGKWDRSTGAEYTRLATEVLPGFGVTEAQVQAVWIKVALASQTSHPLLPDPDADAYQEEAALGDVVRALRQRYPNLQQVFLTSRIYGGYSNPNGHSPEPWAYETGFATKWAIEAQITQRATGTVDSQAGNLEGTPFMAWGPYLWSYGNQPRKDGLMWPSNNFVSDGLHASPVGVEIVGDALLDFFKDSPFTRCWFVEGQTCS